MDAEFVGSVEETDDDEEADEAGDLGANRAADLGLDSTLALALLGCDAGLFLLSVLDLEEFLLVFEFAFRALVLGLEFLVLDISVIVIDRENSTSRLADDILAFLLHCAAAVGTCKIDKFHLCTLDYSSGSISEAM